MIRFDLVSRLRFVVMRGFVFILLALLGGCTAFQPIEIRSDDNPNWLEHSKKNQALGNWGMRGKVAASGSFGISARLLWQQVGENYQIRVTAPLGVGGFVATGNTEQVTLRTSQGDQIAGNPQQLIDQAFGWSFPLISLKYWAAGVPEPNGDYRVDLSEAGFAQSLQQSGWNIDYGDYRQVGQHWLPHQLLLQNDEYRLKMVVSHWGQVS